MQRISKEIKKAGGKKATNGGYMVQSQTQLNAEHGHRVNTPREVAGLSACSLAFEILPRCPRRIVTRVDVSTPDCGNVVETNVTGNIPAHVQPHVNTDAEARKTQQRVLSSKSSRFYDNVHGRQPKAGSGLAAQICVPMMCCGAIQDFCASTLMLIDLMWVPDTLLVISSAILSVLFFDFELGDYAANLSWTAVSFMLMFPLQHAIRSAYARRESATSALSQFRALLVNIFVANARWDWPSNEGFDGRSETTKNKGTPLSVEHTNRVYSLMLQLCDVLQDLLLVPRTGKARHEFTRSGRKEKEQIEAAERKGREHLLKLMLRLCGASEDLKSAGMPAGEASRVNHFIMQLHEKFELLWNYKTYRTPISLRAMMRVLVQLLPLFYGPYWVHIAKGDSANLTAQGTVFAIFFSASVSLITIAMLVMELQMENPYQEGSRDCVHVREEIGFIREALQDALSDMSSTWHERLDIQAASSKERSDE